MCNNSLALPIDTADENVLSIIEDEVLAPSYIEYVLDTAFSSMPDDRLALEAERARLARKVENLRLAIAEGGDTPALVGD